MQRYYGVDLCDLWRGTLSLRRVRVLLEHLPVDSPGARALAEVDGPLSTWPLHDALLARLADELALLRWQWESAHLGKGQRPRKQPPSVMPDQPTTTTSKPQLQADAPVVSPHQLGAFIYEKEGG